FPHGDVSRFTRLGERIGPMLRCSVFAYVLALAMLGSVWGPGVAAAQEKKDDEKSGTVVGALTDKGPNWIEVKADGEEKARRYVPNWVGGTPQQGGGPDKEVVKTIKDLKPGSRVRVEWKFEERPRVIKVEVLKTNDKTK